MIYVTQHDERFWVVQVPRSKTDDPDLLKKMEKEIPAFVHFLQTRSLCTKRESRMHFHHSLIRTPVFYDMVSVNEPGDVSQIREGIKGMFDDFPNEKIIKMPIKSIIEEFLGGRGGQKWVGELLRDHLHVDFEMKNGRRVITRSKYYKKGVDGEGGTQTLTIHTIGHHWIFRREDFIRAEDEALYEEMSEGQLQFQKDVKEIHQAMPVVADDLPF